jgi:hypothetical protein
LLIRFLEFCASKRLRSLKAAWQEFSARPGVFARGRRAARPPQITYGVLRYHLNACRFYEFQAQLKTIESAQMVLAALRVQSVAEIRARLPDRAPRRRVKRENDFQI